MLLSGSRSGLPSPASMRRREQQSGLTLIELIVAFSILMLLSAMAVPTARFQVRHRREKELLADLDEMRTAIDKYKEMCEAQKIQDTGPQAHCYPPSLEMLVEGVKLSNGASGGINMNTNKSAAGSNGSGKVHFLRQIRRDPMTGDRDWARRSMQDDPAADSFGGQNVFDVHSKSTDKASDGTPYAEW